jgi:energy-coupling factor transporter ATP-binding protein EcfA2
MHQLLSTDSIDRYHGHGDSLISSQPSQTNRFMLKIVSIDLNNRSVSLGKLTVLVGPNNVGKSQLLKDILTFMTNGKPINKILVQDLKFSLDPDFESFRSGLEVKDSQDVRLYQVGGLLANLLEGTTMNCDKGTIRDNFNIGSILGNLTSFKVSYLNASSRLNISQQATSSSPGGAPVNPLQGLYRLGKDAEREIQEIFRRAFGMNIMLDYSGLSSLQFKVSKVFPNISRDPQEAYPMLTGYPNLDNQGDGFKSLVGIVAGFILSKERIILLDEPEAFLHPRQCRLLGDWIAKYSLKNDNQIMISTHSGSFLAGVLAANAEVSVFRMNRREDVSNLVPLTASNLRSLSNNPLLSGQPVFKSLFHDGIIVCEGDADRILYQTVSVRYLDNNSIFFVHSHSKQKIKEVVNLMRTSAVPVAAIVDIDILDSNKELCELLEALDPGKDFDEIMLLRKEIEDLVLGKSESDLLEEMVAELNILIQNVSKNIPLYAARKLLYNIYRNTGRWNEIKSKGISILGDVQKNNAVRLVNLCKDHGLFIVHKGELENWIDLGIGKQNKKRWIIKAMESLQKTCPEDLKLFLKESICYLQK